MKVLADKRDDLAYIDVVGPMLKPDGAPKDIFVEDNLHMTPEGYAIWTPHRGCGARQRPESQSAGLLTAGPPGVCPADAAGGVSP